MSRRVSIFLPGFAHANPIPVASRIGPHLVSGVLTGRDPATGKMPPTLDAQCVNLFAHVHELMHAAGGTPDDIIKMTFWLSEYRVRGALNREWTAIFPDAATRPARQVMAAQLDGGSLVQCDLSAILEDAPRA